MLGLTPVFPPRPRWWGQVLLLVGFAWAYDEVRALHGNVQDIAVQHGHAVLQADRFLHLDWSGPLNAWLSRHDGFSDVLSFYYVVMHLGVTSLTLLLLWLSGQQYRRHRNVLLLASLMGLAVYWCYPVAPPRLLGSPFHDTVATVLPFANHVEASRANLYAAVPSLHLAWATWCAVALCSITRRRLLRALAVAHPVITALTVLATGNHYTIDVATGVALTLVSYVLFDVLARRRALSDLRHVQWPEQVSRQYAEEQQERQHVNAGAPQAQRVQLYRLDEHEVADHADAGDHAGEPQS